MKSYDPLFRLDIHKIWANTLPLKKTLFILFFKLISRTNLSCWIILTLYRYGLSSASTTNHLINYKNIKWHCWPRIFNYEYFPYSWTKYMVIEKLHNGSFSLCWMPIGGNRLFSVLRSSCYLFVMFPFSILC